MNMYNHEEETTYRSNVIDTLKRIETQTTRTNGRVSSLERWRSGIIMAMGLFSFVVIPLLVYAFQQAQMAQSQEIISHFK